MAAGSNAPVVGASEVHKLEERVRDLKRLLGRRTMENEILRETLAKAQARKPIWHLPSLPNDGFRIPQAVDGAPGGFPQKGRRG